MSETTYSRTGGHAVLPGTWEYVRGRGDIPDAEKLPPALRFDYDTADADTRAEFNRLAAQWLTTPPDFLRFALATSPNEHLGPYPGEAPEDAGRPANGYLVGLSEEQAARDLGIDVGRIRIELRNFSGPVSLVQLPPGTAMYRTVGLTAQAARYGSITNRLLGPYWEPQCPDAYANEAEWRAATAVKAEWNGDYGHLEVTLSRPVPALVGEVGMQFIGRPGNTILPGGGRQFFIPLLTDAMLATAVTGRSLVQVIRRTRFGLRTEGAAR